MRKADLSIKPYLMPITDKLADYVKACWHSGEPTLRGFPLLPKCLIRRAPYNRQAFNGFVSELSRLKLPRHAVILDLGANHGDFALACQTVCPTSRIHLFEPLPQLFGGLDRLAQSTQGRWTIHRCALGSEAGSAVIEVPLSDDAVGTLAGFTDSYRAVNPASAQTRKIDCEIRPLDEVDLGLNATEMIDLLKIDVEGFEFEVMKGAMETLKRTQSIIVEVSLLRHCDRDRDPVLDMLVLLRSSGFRLRQIVPTLWERDGSNRPLEFDIYADRDN
jgi:FkbM family methyltransferase